MLTCASMMCIYDVKCEGGGVVRSLDKVMVNG